MLLASHSPQWAEGLRVRGGATQTRKFARQPRQGERKYHRNPKRLRSVTADFLLPSMGRRIKDEGWSYPPLPCFLSPNVVKHAASRIHCTQLHAIPSPLNGQRVRVKGGQSGELPFCSHASPISPVFPVRYFLDVALAPVNQPKWCREQNARPSVLNSKTAGSGCFATSNTRHERHPVPGAQENRAVRRPIPDCIAPRHKRSQGNARQLDAAAEIYKPKTAGREEWPTISSPPKCFFSAGRGRWNVDSSSVVLAVERFQFKVLLAGRFDCAAGQISAFGWHHPSPSIPLPIKGRGRQVASPRYHSNFPGNPKRLRSVTADFLLPPMGRRIKDEGCLYPALPFTTFSLFRNQLYNRLLLNKFHPQPARPSNPAAPQLASLSPQWGEGLRVRGGYTHSSPISHCNRQPPC